MARKVIIDVDPGIGDALAVAVALLDPHLDVVGLTATAGCISGTLATRNLQAILGQIDPPKWPRIGTAGTITLAEGLDTSCIDEFVALNGKGGLGDCDFQVAEFHHRKESPRLMSDLIRAEPHQVTLITLGPLHNLMGAADRTPDFLDLVAGIICLGGSISEGGDATPAAEMNFFLNPEAARGLIRGTEEKTLVPLDVTNKAVLTFESFSRLAEVRTRTMAFLRKLLPYYFRAHHQFLGIEGILLREVVPLALISHPELFKQQRMSVDVELRGDLTRGMSVFDRRRHVSKESNVTVVTDIDVAGVVEYLFGLLERP